MKLTKADKTVILALLGIAALLILLGTVA